MTGVVLEPVGRRDLDLVRDARRRDDVAVGSAAIALTELVPMSMPTVISRATCRTAYGRLAGVSAASTLVVQQPVGRYRAPAVGGAVPGEIGEPAAGLLDDHEQRREIPERHDGLGRDVGRALGHEDVAPEVAEAAGAPHLLRQRLELVLEAELAPTT